MLPYIPRWFETVSFTQRYGRYDHLAVGIVLLIGAVVRFWGLGNVGLHGDEETMALPAMAILDTGQPLLPSGMFYSRALLNIYLMAGSVWLFGESEWAFRLPSAIVGSMTGLAAFYMGRRFLPPRVNVAFVATVTFLPALIVASQTARMYVFFVTCVTWFAACIFRWERDQRVLSLAMALMVWCLALHFQTLAVFAAPLFLFPGVSQHSWRQLLQGLAAFASGLLIFAGYARWIDSKYPENAQRPLEIDEPTARTPLEILTSGHDLMIAAVIMAAMLAGGIVTYRLFRSGRRVHAAAPLLLMSGIIAMALLQYHIGGILLLAGVVAWSRTQVASTKWLLLPVVGAVVITALNVAILYDAGGFTARATVGALVGSPSVWPILRFLEYSPMAGVIYLIVLIILLTRFARGNAMPMDVLFFAIAVWVPLLLIGCFAWYIPPRYAQGQLVYFLLCVFSGVLHVAVLKGWVRRESPPPHSIVAAGAVLAVLLVNPFSLARTVNPNYDRYPDHKGAAAYIRSLELPSNAILIAEDVLQQTYYLKSIDYSLRPIDDAAIFSIVRDNRIVDQYTGVPVIGTGAELNRVLDESAGQSVYIIGSGENFVNEKRLLRGQGIAEALESERLECVFLGRDGKTRVWKMRVGQRRA